MTALKNILLRSGIAMLMAPPLCAAVVEPVTFEATDEPIAFEVSENSPPALPELAPATNFNLPTSDALLFDSEYQRLISGERLSRPPLAMGPAHNSHLGLSLAGLIFMLYAARKLYRLSR